jgi:transposase
MIPRELEAKISRLYHAEQWPVGTIASQLQVHHEVVERVLAQSGLPKVKQIRSSMVDPYLPFILKTWKSYPRLPASRLYIMCKKRGYPGSASYFRHRLSRYRPRPLGEAFLRLKTLPGEQAQVDWGHFGRIEIGRANRQLMAFVMVLSWSRAIYLRFFLGQQTENFLRGHEGAFYKFGGVSRTLLYDNLKSAVLERIGDSIRFNPMLLDFSTHYHFEPRPVAQYRGNQKGRVERAIRYIRSGFFEARKFKDLEDLNNQADEWCQNEVLDRPWPEDPLLTVRQAFEQEKPRLIELPHTLYPTQERREARVSKTPYVRFDCNDYSIPHKYTRQTVVVLATLTELQIFKDRKEIAKHIRSFDKGLRIEDPSHIEALIDDKRRRRKLRVIDRLSDVVPSSVEFFNKLAQRGKSLARATQQLMRLLDTYGAEPLEAALITVLKKEIPHVHGVQQLLEQERQSQGKAPILPLRLPDQLRQRQDNVLPHSLNSYDTLGDHKNQSVEETCNDGE